MCKGLFALVLVLGLASVAMGVVNRDIPQGTAPTLDGVISPGEWDGALVFDMAAPMPDGWELGGPEEDTFHTMWYFMWDAGYLHVAGRMYDDNRNFKQNSPGPYNGQDTIQICFNPNNDPAHTFGEGSGVAAIYDLVAETKDSFGPDVYRHGLPDNSVPGALSSGTVHDDGWTYEGSIPWSELMTGADTGYVPSLDDVHGLGLILVSVDDSGTSLITDFGNGANTIGTPTTWSTMTLVRGIQATNPDPEDGEDRVQPNKVLSWDPPDPCNLVDPPAEYIVYFDPNESLVSSGNASVCFGQQSQNQFDPFGVGDMKLVTTYYWRIDVVDPNFGEPVIYAGKVWHFTTITPKAGLISPENGASGVAQNAVLEWSPGIGAIEHDVYIDPCEAWVVGGDARAYKIRQEETCFDPDLDWETQYFWRIDEVLTGGGDPVPGDVWSFTTTGTRICEEPLPADFDKNCVVNLEDLALMVGNWLICNLTNGDCP